MNALSRILIFAVLCLSFAPSRAAESSAPGDNPPIPTVRLKDEITMHARLGYLTFTETIVVAPVERKPEGPRPPGNNLVHLLIAPMWLKDGSFEGAAFPMLRPQLNLSSGRVRRFALVRPDGEAVRNLEDITRDCRYLLTIDLGHMLPERITVTVQMSSPTGINPGAELTYQPSNDGHPRRSGPTETSQTVAHIIADEPLEPWVVSAGEKTVPRRQDWITLERDVSHTIRLGSRASQ